LLRELIALLATDCQLEAVLIANNPMLNPTDNITYKVTGTTIFYCSSTDEIFIEVKKTFQLIRFINHSTPFV
jgi:hypothetical protein